MKILLLCQNGDDVQNNNILKINNQSAIYGYFFKKYLLKYSDVEVIVRNLPKKRERDIVNFPECDFSIILINRGTTIFHDDVYNLLRLKTKHWICTICGTNKIIGKEDILFFMMGKRKCRTLRINWGGDDELLIPNKPKKTSILIDHKYYGEKTSRIAKGDKTDFFVKSLLDYKKKNKKIIIKQIASNKVRNIEDIKQLGNFRQAEAVPFTEIYKDYCEAHIYIVTHEECLGLTVIECALAGALIVLPKNYIKGEIIKKLHHVSINFDTETNIIVDWNSIIKEIDVEKSRKMASEFLYSGAIGKVYNLFKRKEENNNLNCYDIIGK